MDAKVGYVFRFLNSKYQSWWRKRIDTDVKREAEMAAFEAALAGFELWQVRAGLALIIERRAGCMVSPPPTADKLAAAIREACGGRTFAGYMRKRELGVLSERNRQHLAEIKALLR